MKSEKVKEIKDNITVCTTKIGCNGCSLLPIMASTNCRNKLLEDALNLINELEKENKILKGTKDRLTFADRIKLVNNAVETKLKQFAERLKEKYGKSCSEYYPLLLEFTSEQLDETLKDFIK